MSDLTQADIDEAIADYQQRIDDLCRRREAPPCQDVSMAGRPRTDEAQSGAVAAIDRSHRIIAHQVYVPTLTVQGHPDAVVLPDGSIGLMWSDGSMPAMLTDSVVRVIAAAILSTGEAT
ncbi:MULTISPECIES: hypothetical protein [unclassified Aeromicrobium]|uniref:hypothetical protein n=1 Tax=unclassified Aeromicrobium TaxID=2633570 RepID=UPI002889CD30|nr:MULTISPECIES: hypothetical protein [unclassified Aeromicrobium]